MSELYEAVEAGKLDVVQDLINKGVDFDTPNEDSEKTPLAAAAAEGYLEIVELLLEKGADVTKGCSAPILEAAANGHTQVVLSLLGKNGDINAVLRYKERYDSEEKLTVLMTAAKKGQNTLIKSLLEQGAEVNQKKETETGNEEECDKVNANTALAFAAENGAVEVVNTLIEHGADVKQEGELSLLLAATDGYDEIVQMLIEKGADVNFVEPKSENTALTLAAADGNNKSVLTLIEHGADVNHQNKKQRTPLIMAVTEGGNIDVIRTLLKHNAEKDTKDEDCYSALIYAVISMSSDYVSLLLEHGAGMTKFYYDGKEETCLSWAAAFGDNDIVTALIKHGADVNFANEENETALSNAAKGGYIECVEKLLEYGAKVDIGNPVAAAVDGGNIKIAAILLKHGAFNIERNLDEDPLLTKAILEMPFKGSDFETVALLIDLGADVNAQRDDGRFALQVAAMNAQPEVIKLLLKKGAKINMADNRGSTALMETVESGSEQHNIVLKTLLESKADPNLKNKDGKTVLTIAAEMGRVESARILADYGAETSQSTLAIEAFLGNTSKVLEMLEQGIPADQAKDEYSKTPLILAASNGKIDTVIALLEHGADINKEIYETALIGAVKRGDSQLVKVLLERGADVSISYGHTPLVFAAINGHVEIINMLLEHGASLNEENSKTPLMYAAEYGQTDIVKTFIDNGADVGATDDDPMSHKDAYDLAVEKGHTETASIIAEKLTPEALSSKLTLSLWMPGRMPVFFSVLKMSNCNVDLPDGNGYTALMKAALYGNCEALRGLLVDKKANPNIKCEDDPDMAAIDYAVQENEKEAVEILLKHGAAVTAKTLELAEELSDKDILNLLKSTK